MTPTISSQIRPYSRLFALLGASAAGALALAQAAPAAEPAGGVPAVYVHYDDLNLASPEGTQALYRRIAAAAARVCPDADQRDLERYRASRTCQTQAIESAVRQVHDPRLAALAERIGKG
jgi:UrcA family protein